MVLESGFVVTVVKIIQIRSFLCPFNNMFSICIINVTEVFIALHLFACLNSFVEDRELRVLYFELVGSGKGQQNLLCQFTFHACMSSGIGTSVRFRIGFS